MKESAQRPYFLYRLQKMPTSYVSQEYLDEIGIGIYQGEFVTDQGLKVKAVILPRELVMLQKQREIQGVFHHAGVDNYFRDEIPRVDLQRAWELQTSITDKGIARITDKDGVLTKVYITADTVREALQFRVGVRDIPARSHPNEYKKVFHYQLHQGENFEDLVHRELDEPLKIFTQHFEPAKAPRYTQPAKRVALHFTQALLSPDRAYGKYDEYVLNSIISYATHSGMRKNPVLATGHMLTRIAYYALGMIEDLKPTQNNNQLAAMCMAVKLNLAPEKPVVSRRSSRFEKVEGVRLESVPPEKDEKSSSSSKATTEEDEESDHSEGEFGEGPNAESVPELEEVLEDSLHARIRQRIKHYTEERKKEEDWKRKDEAAHMRLRREEEMKKSQAQEKERDEEANTQEERMGRKRRASEVFNSPALSKRVQLTENEEEEKQDTPTTSAPPSPTPPSPAPLSPLCSPPPRPIPQEEVQREGIIIEDEEEAKEIKEERKKEVIPPPPPATVSISEAESKVDPFFVDLQNLTMSMRSIRSRYTTTKVEKMELAEKVKEQETLIAEMRTLLQESEQQISRNQLQIMTQKEMEKLSQEMIDRLTKDKLQLVKNREADEKLLEERRLHVENLKKENEDGKKELQQAIVAREIAEEQLQLINGLLQKFKERAPQPATTSAIATTSDATLMKELQETKVLLESERIQKHYLSMAVAHTKRQSQQEIDELKAKVGEMRKQMEEMVRQSSVAQAQQRRQNEVDPVPEITNPEPEQETAFEEPPLLLSQS